MDLVYNLFPTLIKLPDWKKIAKDAAEMGFTHIYVNPISRTGVSGSLYSISDFFKYNQRIFPLMSDDEIEDFLKDFCGCCLSMGIKPILDLVPNHVADSSGLIQRYPEWFEYDNGVPRRAYYIDNGVSVPYGDIVRIRHETDADTSFWYFYNYCQKFLDIGFVGFRVDMASYIEPRFLKLLIANVKSQYPNTFFLAESVGHVNEKIYQNLSDSQFNCALNSGFWWDLSADWFVRQLNESTKIIPTITFAESHDTERLINVVNGNIDLFRQRMWVTGLMSSGFMISSGMERANRRRLDVFTTTPNDWDSGSYDFSGEIKRLLSIKKKYEPLCNECEISIMSNNDVFIQLKKTYNNSSVTIKVNKTADTAKANGETLRPYETLLETNEGVYSSLDAA